MQALLRSFLAITLASIAFAGVEAHSQSHPSGVSQRVLIAVQNPTGVLNGANIIAPQFSLQIANVVTNGFPTSAPPTISGYGAHAPARLENLPTLGYGLVHNEDGTVFQINYGSEAITGSNLGGSGPLTGSLLTQDGRYMITVDRQRGALTVLDRQLGSSSVKLNLPGVASVSTNTGYTAALVFVADSNVVYYLQHLNAADQQAYASAWPALAVDCEPLNLPQFCLMKLAPSAATANQYANSNFDHPVKAVFSSDGTSVFILNGGPEADGTTASVTSVPMGAFPIEDGMQVGTIPASLSNFPTPGGADNGISIGAYLYVAGQIRVSPGVWGGRLTIINPGAGTVSSPMNIADGFPNRMVLGDDNTLWIGSARCFTGQGGNNGTPTGCLSVVNLVTNSVGFIEAYSCQIDSNQPCSGDHPDSYRWSGGGSGDVTGIAPITGHHEVYYIEHGQVHIRQTTSPYSIVPNNGVSVAGVAVDVVYMDAPANNDGTATSSQH